MLTGATVHASKWSGTSLFGNLTLNYPAKLPLFSFRSKKWGVAARRRSRSDLLSALPALPNEVPERHVR
jgi:hypothetical protein